MSFDAEKVRATLRDKIRNIPDFPSPGILFRDITPVLADAWLCGASTISKSEMSMSCSPATASMRCFGPTRTGAMMSALAASTAAVGGPSGFSFDASLIESLMPYSRSSASIGLPGT